MKTNLELMGEFITWYESEHPTARAFEIRDAWVKWVQENRTVWAKPGCSVCGDPWWRCGHEPDPNPEGEVTHD